jgi:hypothetical protein
MDIFASPFSGMAMRYVQTSNANFVMNTYNALTNVGDVDFTVRVNSTTVANTYVGIMFAGVGTSTSGMPNLAYMGQLLSSGVTKIIKFDAVGVGTDIGSGAFTPAYSDFTYRVMHLQDNIVTAPANTTATGRGALHDTTLDSGYIGLFNGVFAGSTATQYYDNFTASTPGLVIMNVGNSLTQGNHCAESDAYRYGLE